MNHPILVDGFGGDFVDLVIGDRVGGLVGGFVGAGVGFIGAGVGPVGAGHGYILLIWI